MIADRSVASCAGQADLPLFSQPRCVTQRLKYVLSVQIGVIDKESLYTPTGTDLSDDHANGHTHPTNTGFSTHHAWLLGDPVKFSLYLSAYWPKEAILNVSWMPPNVEKA